MCKKNKTKKIKKNDFILRLKRIFFARPFTNIFYIYSLVSAVFIFAFGGWYWLLGLPWAFALIHFVYFFITDKVFFRNIRLYNLLVFGYRRSGKDLSIQKYVYMRYSKKYKKIIKKNKLSSQLEIDAYFDEKPLYLSLYDYGYGAKIVPINDFELFNKATGRHVSYTEFIEGATIVCDKKPMYEGLDFILGEAHLSLPNTEHNTLDKVYKWLPVFISLSGHLYNMNVIINSQEFNRSWVKIRNQQDRYMKTLKTFPRGSSWLSNNRKWFPFINNNIYTRLRIYEEYQSAESNILPFKAPALINEATKTVYLSGGMATKEQFNATHGRIIDLWIKTPVSIIRYDSRFFHERIFHQKAPTK